MAEKPNILIAVPAYGGTMTNECTKSLSRLQSAFHASGIRYGNLQIDRADIAMVRNLFASVVVQNPHITHLAQIDQDMEFRPEAFLRMLAASKPVIGCIYPKRQIDISLALKLAREGHDDGSAIARSMTYASPVEGVTAGNSIASVPSIAMGVSLIERRVFLDLIETKQLTLLDLKNQSDCGVTGQVHGFFDTIPGQSEDTAFCRRWVDLCGGEINALIDEAIGHVGRFVFRAKFSDSLA